MMTVNTRDFGEQTIEENKIITFPDGIYAFENMHRFIMLSPLGNDVYPAWLQCLDDENLCFIVFDPKQIVKDYSVTADEGNAGKVKPGDGNTKYLALAVVPEDYKDTTVNLKSPIVINADKMLAAQIIAAENYPIKFPIFKKEGE